MSEKGSNKFKKKGGGGGGGKYFPKKGTGGNFGSTSNKGDPTPLTTPKDMEWRHFLSVKDFKDISIQTKIKLAEQFLEDKLPNKISNDGGFFTSFPLNYPDLLENRTLKEKWPSLEDDLAFSADQVLGIFAHAASVNRKKRFFPRCDNLTTYLFA